MSVTMRDVAELAGVSVATVSRVFAGREPVAESKRRSVLEASDKLGYQLDALAAALRSGSSASVGILVPDITNPFFPAIIQTVEHELSRAAIDVFLADSDNDVKIEAQRIEMLLRRRVEALLICPVHSEKSAPSLRKASKAVKVLQLDRSVISSTDFLGADQAAAMSQVVDHLTDGGVRDAIFVGASNMSSIAERESSFLNACERVGIVVRDTLTLAFPDTEHGRLAARELAAAGGALPDAVVCANDEVAFGFLLEFRVAGIRCPEDVVLVGYDDIPAAEWMGLTSVHQPLEELGREAAHLLTHPTASARRVRLTPTLIPRASSARTRPD